ncbi:SGNH hydrolase-type esterase domain-containing protein [Corynascus similis CBS 632.67]
MESILADLRPIAKFKARSRETSKTVHIPLLLHQSDSSSQGPSVVLLGDSMFERMTTTGESPNLVAPWPSPAMMSDDRMHRLFSLDGKKVRTTERKRLDGVFNAGVGGDRIQNLAYRLVGSGSDANADAETDEINLPGLLPVLAARGTVKVWVVHVGTNNLSPKKGLSDGDADALRRVVGAVLQVNPEKGRCKVLVTGLFYRRDVTRELVNRANDKVRQVVEALQEQCGTERVAYLPPAAAVKPEEHLVDHVHLSLDGYKLWVDELFPKVASILDSVGR